MKRGDAFEIRTLYAPTPAENHNVSNKPDGRKLILPEFLVALPEFQRVVEIILDLVGNYRFIELAQGFHLGVLRHLKPQHRLHLDFLDARG